MEKTQGGRVLHYDASNPEDMAALVANGLIWKGPASAQQAAIEAIIAGDIPMGANMPPEIESQLKAAMGEAPQ